MAAEHADTGQEYQLMFMGKIWFGAVLWISEAHLEFLNNSLQNSPNEELPKES